MIRAFLSAHRRALSLLLVGLGWLAAPPTSTAFPPALPHVIYGLVRDEQGNPLTPGASIIFETASGVKVYSVVSDVLQPGVNYRISVPLDAGLTSDIYKATAVSPAAPFKIKVSINGVVFLPIEMTHDFAHLGEPGKSTLINLTLGEDSNGDGLPDAWQRRINADLSKVGPNADADGDGMSNMQEYLAGTYAFDPQSGFTLSISRMTNGAPVLAFTAIAGRSYTVLGAATIDAWTPVQFRFVGTASDSAPLVSYVATDVRPVQIEVVSPADKPAPRFFKLMLQ